MHGTSVKFWATYNERPNEIRRIADKQFSTLKANPNHPSLQCKKIGMSKSCEISSARVTQEYRAHARKHGSNYERFWIGEHDRNDLLSRDVRQTPPPARRR